MTSIVEKNWIGLRRSGLRIVLLGVSSLIVAFIIYGRLTTPSGEQPVMITSYLMNLANAIFTIIFVSMLFVGYGIYRIFKAEQRLTANTNSLVFYITAAFLDNKYWKMMAIFAIVYGIFFGFLSQIFIYRYDVSFSEQGIIIPSANVIPCCNLPGYVPMTDCISYRSLSNHDYTDQYYSSSSCISYGRIQYFFSTLCIQFRESTEY